MRIMSVIMLAFSLSLSARTVSQTVTFKGQNVPLTQLFEEVKKQTGFYVMYSNEQVANAKPVSIEAQQLPVKEFVSAILENQPFQFSIEGNTVFIRTKIAAVHLSPRLTLDTLPMKGVIRDAEGKPLQGINVVVKGTKRGVVTDAYGNFSIQADINETLVISSVGYSSKEVQVANINIPILVALEKSVSQLDEVQYIAYGTTTQRFNTGNVSTLKAEEIEKQPVINVLQAMQGRLPGVFITQQTGFNGGGFKVQIRGMNSFSNGTEPLYVVDGIPISPNLNGRDASDGFLDGLAASPFGAGASPSALSYINPQDIESIDVLKDAEATAIYGSRGANGVILITTKKGRVGKTIVDLNAQYGWGRVPKRLKLMNTQQYLEMRNEAFKNDNVTPSADPNDFLGYAPDLKIWDTLSYIDWQKELIGETANYIDVQAGVSGGNELMQYAINSNYHKESTVFPASYSDNKGGVHFSISGNSSNRKFSAMLTGSYYVDNNKLPSQDITSYIYNAPNAPAPFNEEGSLNWAPISPGGNGTVPNNPFAILRTPFQVNVNNLLSSALISYKILKNLEVKTSLGYNVLQSNSYSAMPFAVIDPATWPFNLRRATFANTGAKSWSVEPQVNYNKKMLKGQLTVLVGGTFQERNTSLQKFDAFGFSSDRAMKNLQAATDIIPTYASSQYKYTALFGRVGYNWDNKYLISLNARRDGSSRFGPRKQFGYFGSASVGWIFSEEKIIRENLAFINFGKLRGSYGTVGNDQIKDYQFLDIYLYDPRIYQDSRGVYPRSVFNPYFAWETTRKLEGGLELGFLKGNRILLNLSYYRNRSSNQLTITGLADYVGPSPDFVENVAALLQNDGLEVTLSTTNMKSEDFLWTTSFNTSFGRNKVIKTYNPGNSLDTRIGLPLGYSKVFKIAGIDPATGLYLFLDSIGKPTTTPDYSKDQTQLFNTNFPKYFLGIQNGITYKNFQIDFFIQLVRQQGRIAAPFMAGSMNINMPVSFLDRWQKQGDITSGIRYSTSDFNVIENWRQANIDSELGYGNASYIRLKNVSLSWQIPKRIIESLNLRKAKIYVQGQNLLTYTKYKGLDPESLSYTGLPPLKVLTFGVQVSF